MTKGTKWIITGIVVFITLVMLADWLQIRRLTRENRTLRDRPGANSAIEVSGDVELSVAGYTVRCKSATIRRGEK